MRMRIYSHLCKLLNLGSLFVKDLLWSFIALNWDNSNMILVRSKLHSAEEMEVKSKNPIYCINLSFWAQTVFVLAKHRKWHGTLYSYSPQFKNTRSFKTLVVTQYLGGRIQKFWAYWPVRLEPPPSIINHSSSF